MADNNEILECPACYKEMKKVFVKSLGINVDICLDGCGGIYFDRQELKKFDEAHESIDDILEAISGKTFEAVNEGFQRICPWCHGNMVKNYSSSNATIQIDECYSCGGIFLDNGELQKIRDEFATEGLRSEAFSKKLREVLNEQKAEELQSKAIMNSQEEVEYREFKEASFLDKFIKMATFGIVDRTKYNG